MINNKTDNIHINEAQKSNIDKDRVAANITEYRTVSKLIFQRISISRFMMTRQFYHLKIVCKMLKINMSKMNVRNFWSDIKLLRFLYFISKYQNILTYLN